jgi:hypothetical protein
VKLHHWRGGGRWASFGVVVFVATSACVVSYGPTPVPYGRDGVQGRRECPGEGVTLKVDTGRISYIVTHVPLSDSITNIPEFHDCQRFIRDTSGKLVFDSLFAIFASFRLESLPQDLDSSKDTITLDNGVHVATVPVATIFSDHQRYDSLGIKPGFNCLLLYRRSVPVTPQGFVWGAKMIPLPFPDSNCVPVKPQMEGKTLQVLASSIRGLAESDYPAAARWDWDPRHSEQYIGIKCGAAWCQVGRMGFDTSASYSGPSLPFKPIGVAPFTDAERRRVTAIRGWYDEQRLAEHQGGWTKPSALRGILVPNPDIDGLKSTPNMYDSTWVQVGFAVLIGGDYHKWNYRQRVNEVLLCHGSATDCKVENEVQTQPPEPPSTMALTSCTTGWWATVRPLPSGKPRIFCLRETNHQQELDDLNSRHPNMVSSIPGTARWRWLLEDEGSWFGCMSSSCCTKQ